MFGSGPQRPSYDELAALVTEPAAVIATLTAEVTELRAEIECPVIKHERTLRAQRRSPVDASMSLFVSVIFWTPLKESRTPVLNELVPTSGDGPVPRHTASITRIRCSSGRCLPGVGRLRADAQHQVAGQ